jgi:hypothetical protein
MTELLTQEELWVTPFEPHLTNRFICNIDGIEPHLIYAVSGINFGPDTENYGYVKIYHAIVPDPMVTLDTLAQISRNFPAASRERVMNDIVIRHFGPVGDVTAHTTLHGCEYVGHTFETELSYADSSTFNSIRLDFTYRNAEYTYLGSNGDVSDRKILLGDKPKIRKIKLGDSPEIDTKNS